MVTEKDFKQLLRLNKMLMQEVQELKELVKGKIPNEPEKFLTKKQASEYLQLSMRQVDYLLAKNELPFATKVGSRWRFPQSALERYAARM